MIITVYSLSKHVRAVDLEWPLNVTPAIKNHSMDKIYCRIIRVDGICGSEQSGTVKNGGVKNEGVDNSAPCGRGGQCGRKNVPK